MECAEPKSEPLYYFQLNTDLFVDGPCPMISANNPSIIGREIT